MCKAIDYYFEKISFDCFNRYDKTSKVTVGRPRYEWKRLFKVFLFSIYTVNYLRKLHFKLKYGSEISSLNDGLEAFPNRLSTFCF